MYHPDDLTSETGRQLAPHHGDRHCVLPGLPPNILGRVLQAGGASTGAGASSGAGAGVGAGEVPRILGPT